MPSIHSFVVFHSFSCTQGGQDAGAHLCCCQGSSWKMSKKKERQTIISM